MESVDRQWVIWYSVNDVPQSIQDCLTAYMAVHLSPRNSRHERGE